MKLPGIVGLAVAVSLLAVALRRSRRWAEQLRPARARTCADCSA